MTSVFFLGGEVHIAVFPTFGMAMIYFLHHLMKFDETSRIPSSLIIYASIAVEKIKGRGEQEHVGGGGLRDGIVLRRLHARHGDGK